MPREHCQECDDKDREIRELKDRLADKTDSLNKAVDHLHKVERDAERLYDSIRTNFR